MISIILAAILGGSLYLSLHGALWATHVIIFFLTLNVVLVAYSMTVVAGLQRTLLLNAEKRIEELDKMAINTDVPVMLLLRVFLLVCVWHLYTLGYAFFAGVAATTVLISVLVTLLRSIDSSVSEKGE
jgi:hypothetical protein